MEISVVFRETGWRCVVEVGVDESVAGLKREVLSRMQLHHEPTHPPGKLKRSSPRKPQHRRAENGNTPPASTPAPPAGQPEQSPTLFDLHLAGSAATTASTPDTTPLADLSITAGCEVVLTRAAPVPATGRYAEGLSVWSLSLSPCGRLLAVGEVAEFGEQGRVAVWDTASAAAEAGMEGRHRGSVCAAFSRCGAWGYTGDDTGRLRRWRVATWERSAAMKGHNSQITSVATGGGRIASSSYDCTVRVWSPAPHDMTSTPNTCLAVVASGGHALTVSLSPTTGHTLCGGADGFFGIWPALGEDEVVAVGGGADACFVPLDALCDGGGVGEGVEEEEGEGGVTASAVSPDGEWVICGGDAGCVRVWRGGCRRVCRGHVGAVRSAAVAPDSRRAATGGVGEVLLWDLQTGDRLRRLEVASCVWGLQFSPCGRWLFIGAAGVTVVDLLEAAG